MLGGGVVRALSGWDEYRAFIERLDEDHRSGAALAAIPLLYGSEFDFGNDGRLVAIARDLQGWGGLCQFISNARNDDGTPKGDYQVGWDTSDLALLGEGCELLLRAAAPGRRCYGFEAMASAPGLAAPTLWHWRCGWGGAAPAARRRPVAGHAAGRPGRTAACRWWPRAAC
jgi:hypothetical protein